MEALLGLAIFAPFLYLMWRGAARLSRGVRMITAEPGATVTAIREVPSRRASRPLAERNREAAQLGVLTALLMPPVGFVMSIALFLRGQVGPGIGVLLLCPIGIFTSILVWGVIFAAL